MHSQLFGKSRYTGPPQTKGALVAAVKRRNADRVARAAQAKERDSLHALDAALRRDSTH